MIGRNRDSPTARAKRMAQDKDISRTRETLLPGFFCLCCTLCGISEISTFHAYFHSSGIATSGVADDGALQPFATNITTSDIAFERPEGGASIEVSCHCKILQLSVSSSLEFTLVNNCDKFSVQSIFVIYIAAYDHDYNHDYFQDDVSLEHIER